jgi:hypothetical protein
MATGWGAVLPAGSGTLVVALAGASVGTDAGGVGAAVPVKNAGAVDDPPLHAASAVTARKTGPTKSRPVRGKRIGMRRAS